MRTTLKPVALFSCALYAIPFANVAYTKRAYPFFKPRDENAPRKVPTLEVHLKTGQMLRVFDEDVERFLLEFATWLEVTP